MRGRRGRSRRDVGRGSGGSDRRRGRGCDTAEATLAVLKIEQGLHQGLLVEIGPEHIGDVDFGVGQLLDRKSVV